mgnify:CR=1 FL=1
MKLKPFNRYGKPISKLSWFPISYKEKNGHGSYILKFEAGGKSLRHKHLEHEEFLILKGSCLQLPFFISKKRTNFNH